MGYRIGVVHRLQAVVVQDDADRLGLEAGARAAGASVAPMALLRTTLKASWGSTTVSPMIGTAMFLEVSPAMNLSVPLVTT